MPYNRCPQCGKYELENGEDYYLCRSCGFYWHTGDVVAVANVENVGYNTDVHHGWFVNPKKILL